jgi:cytochrome c-type biogenesis protein CcmH/NrfG
MLARWLVVSTLLFAAFSADAGDQLSADERATVSRWLALERAEDTPPRGVLAARPAPPIDQLLAGLEKRLQDAPGDQAGWMLLAQTYAWLGRMDEARAAADTAVALGADGELLEGKLVAAHTRRMSTD